MRKHLNFSHTRALFDPLLVQPLHVIGVGSVGGFVVANAAKAGVRDITAYDPDYVESHNIPMSIYRQDHDIGRLKTVAITEIVRDQCGLEIKCVPRRYGGKPLKGGVIACVDTLDARWQIWEKVRDNVNVSAFIDTRINAKYVAVHMVNPNKKDQIASYEKLFPDTKPSPQSCGEHGFITASQIAASAAIEFLTEAWSSGTVERHFRVQTGLLWQLVTVNDTEDQEQGEEDDGEEG